MDVDTTDEGATEEDATDMDSMSEKPEHACLKSMFSTSPQPNGLIKMSTVKLPSNVEEPFFCIG